MSSSTHKEAKEEVKLKGCLMCAPMGPSSVSHGSFECITQVREDWMSNPLPQYQEEVFLFLLDYFPSHIYLHLIPLDI